MIVWTKEMIYITKGDSLLDTIPLHEVLNINETSDDFSTSQRMIATRRPDSIRTALTETVAHLPHSKSRRSLNKTSGGCLQLKTIPDGFNAGRAYHLKTNGTSCSLIAAQLSEAVKCAKKKFDRKSSFVKIKDKVKEVQESFMFQVFVGLLIVAVRRSLFLIIISVIAQFAMPNPEIISHKCGILRCTKKL
jgi:hypothetical protein